MPKCPCCNRELVDVDGKVKFAAQIGNFEKKQPIDDLEKVMEE
jgi:hypothetical protein